MDKVPDIDSYNRLAGALIDNNKTYEDAEEILNSFVLKIICNEKIQESESLQAALVTVVNTGKRCFLGGASIDMPPKIKNKLKNFNFEYLNDLIKHILGKVNKDLKAQFSLKFGCNAQNSKELEIVASAWQGGVVPFDNNLDISLPEENNILLGGVAAGSLGVALAFLKVSKIDLRSADKLAGISLWRPDLNWLDKEAEGPGIDNIPKKIWVAGLGHLGQSYLWNLRFLPFKNSSECEVLLQDYDIITDANYQSGLLCEKENVKKKKARVCSEWLEEFGVKTTICERKYDNNTIPSNNEPQLVLSGFDNKIARSNLDSTKFSLIVDAGLGGTKNSFDDIQINVFPNSNHTPMDLWGNSSINDGVLNKNVLKAFKSNDKCGMIQLANKAISTSFVGAFAGSLVISEILRACNLGKRYAGIGLQLRSIEEIKLSANGDYWTELVRNGLLNVN